ncbi:MAG TPA: alpha/beta fold hydrolase [Candidatus Acidoferrales bacterium]|nr:alpha/beta fold hydrolase [Candidatus Acidoferrales bacterium]
MKKAVTIWSEGTRMAGDLFLPDDLKAGEKRPAILLCHGWAGPKSHLSATYAPFFCKGGFVCLTFDYRGWYESDARIATLEKQPPVDADGFVTVRGRAVREVVDPLDQNRDINNALDYLIAEPAVDPSRIGLWGSSFGGGHVLYVAGHDPRIKAVVSQVPGMGPAPDVHGFATPGPEVQKLASAMARGDIQVLPRPAGQPESLKGIGDFRTMWRYLPRVAAANIRVPTLIIDQEQEEYGGRENSGLAAKNSIPSSTIVKYHVFPGTHYDIYEKNYRESGTMARDWFIEHLMP